MYISTAAALESFLDHAHGESVIAVDTEFLRERTFFPKLCLLQLGTRERQAAIDPLAGLDLSGVAALLANPAIVKVFHACTQDVEILAQTFGRPPANVFDTQIAAAFLGQRMQLGYGALVESYCGVHLPKAASLPDWSRRPLDDEQIQYAEDDVRYLPGIYDEMVAELEGKGRLGWVLPECELALDHALRAQDGDEAYLHVRRSGNLTRRQLAVLRETAKARDAIAKRKDIPRKWVISDEVLVETSRRSPKTIDALRRVRGTAQLSEADADKLLLAVKRGIACPDDRLPPVHHRAKPSQETESVVDLMYALLRLVSEESGIAVPLIATRDDLLELALGHEPRSLTEGWRAELVGGAMRRLLSGKIGLTVKDGKVVQL